MKSTTLRMFAKFEKYYVESSTIMAIATILDPWYKFQSPRWAFKKNYGADYKIDLFLLKEKLFSLLGEYSKSTKRSCPTANMSYSNVKASNVKKTPTHWCRCNLFKKGELLIIWPGFICFDFHFWNLFVVLS